jgi:hypothetical protein
MMLQVLLALGGATTFLAAQPAPPPDLAALMAKARVEGKLMSWCRGQFRGTRPNGYAVAVVSASGGGRYLALDGDATVVELAPFKGAPDLACYTPAEARKINETIGRSETISGKVAPVFATTVVCGFVENTSAVCWQYSPKAREFVKVGEWQT